MEVLEIVKGVEGGEQDAICSGYENLAEMCKKCGVSRNHPCIKSWYFNVSKEVEDKDLKDAKLINEKPVVIISGLSLRWCIENIKAYQLDGKLYIKWTDYCQVAS